MGNDDLHRRSGNDPHSLHLGHPRGRTIDVVGWIGYTFRIEVADRGLAGRHPAIEDETVAWYARCFRTPGTERPDDGQ